jgi:hypothetical protein
MKRISSLAIGVAAIGILVFGTATFAASNGEPAEPVEAPQGTPAGGYSLTYDSFVGTCNVNGFSTSAVAYADFATEVRIDGTTTLDGAPYDTYAFGLPGGAYSFGTGFARGFAPALADATYTFVFNSRILAEGLKGTSIITISCSDGVLSGSNVFDLHSTQEIPTLGQLGLGALALLLGGGAIFALRRKA